MPGRCAHVSVRVNDWAIDASSAMGSSPTGTAIREDLTDQSP
jgi:hypothetical protein